jgi:uncharacterized repeat protein (TIGR01451 family)
MSILNESFRRAPVYVALLAFLLTLGIGSASACQCAISVSGTKTVSGTFEAGGTVTYTVVLTVNGGPFDQQDNSGDEFVDTLPAGVTLVSATATSGTAVASVGKNLVTWNGSIPNGGSVTITITATIDAGTAGQTIANQGTINYDVEEDGDNESVAFTDDPGTIPLNDATRFTVGGAPAAAEEPPPPPPPPPASPLCNDQNFDSNGVVHASVSDALGTAINCRVLYQNNAPAQWNGGSLYSSGSIGIPGIVELGIQQAIDIFSPSGQGYFQGGGVFCLRGEGTLIWLAAKNQPRHAEIIGSYTVPEFEGFTCATLFEPGTLILVTETPAT